MDSFNKTNLQNIKDIFEEKTGVALETRRRRQPIRAAMLVAAVLVCSLTMTAFAVSLFSSLSGDDLSLSATYEGNGIVTIQVANKSDKDLSFQRQLKLMRWSTGKEVEPVSDTIVFDGTEFEAAYERRYDGRPLQSIPIWIFWSSRLPMITITLC